MDEGRPGGWRDGLEGEHLRLAESVAKRVKALSGPGTGKTYGMMRRVWRLIEEGVPPERILVVTLTRTAAEDLKRSLAALGVEGADRVVARTLHSHCFSILSRARVLDATGVVPRILTGFERAALLRDINVDLDMDEKAEMVRLFASAWSSGREDRAPGQPVERLDQEFQDQLLRWLRWHRGMLLDELVPQALRYLRHDPLAPELGEFDHVLVDEYQDLNRADQAVVDLLSAAAGSAVVGDDDQSIYGFRFAFPEGIVDLAADDVIELVECRRCPQDVVALANALVRRNRERGKPELQPYPSNPPGEIQQVRYATAEEEAHGIARLIADRIQSGELQPGECLVVVNSRKHGGRIRQALLEAGVEAQSFFKEEPLATSEASEALTLLTLLLDLDDRIALRAWIGSGSSDSRKGAYRRLWEEADRSGTTVSDVLEKLGNGEINLPYCHHALARWEELQARRRELEPLREDLPALVDALIPDGDETLAGLRQAAVRALEARPDDARPGRFPEEVRKQIGLPDVPFDATFVRVMSLHRSKGLTARFVAVAGLVDGLVPKYPREGTPEEEAVRQMEEQRRLMFVAITRTTQTLILSSFRGLPYDEAKKYKVKAAKIDWPGKVVYTLPSPLLAELGDALPNAITGEALR